MFGFTKVFAEQVAQQAANDVQAATKAKDMLANSGPLLDGCSFCYHVFCDDSSSEEKGKRGTGNDKCTLGW